MIIKKPFSIKQARELVMSCFADLAEESETRGGFVPRSDYPDMETREQHHMSYERIIDLRSQISSRTYEPSLRRQACEHTPAKGIPFTALPEQRQADILQGYARALIKQQRLYRHRIEDRLGEFHPADPLLDALPTDLAFPFLNQQEHTVAPVQGPTVSSAIQSYLANRQKAWRGKTLAGRIWQLRYLEEFLGSELPLASVTSHNIRAFRDGIMSLRKNHGRTPSQSFAQKQTANEHGRIAAKTASLILEPTKAFFRGQNPPRA